MGTALDQLENIIDFHKRGLVPTGGTIVDIGCQQLYGADVAGIERFMSYFRQGNVSGVPLQEYAENGAFIGFPLTAAGFVYRSFDIVEAPFCEALDLNFGSLDERRVGIADLTLNFGTTEHVLNQYNALKILHDFTKPGGLIYSFFIRGGHMEHGLVHYSDRFVDLWCGFNNYEQIWRADHNVAGSECTWIAVRKTSDAAFKDIIDVQEGDGLPKLRRSQQ
jgi:hypothetical protein